MKVNNKFLIIFRVVVGLVLIVVVSGFKVTRKAGSDIKTDETTKYELVKDWPQLPDGYVLGNPTGIGIDTSQNIFVFIRAHRRWTDPMPETLIAAKTILMFDRHSGKILKSWGDHLFIMPHGLTVDKHNNVWVTDVGLQQVFKFNHDGKLLMKLGTEKAGGNDTAHFNLPTDIAVADDGSFYVSDGYGNSRVVKFSAMGKYLFEWGTRGSKPGEFNLPHAIDLDANGNVYVADRQNCRVQQFDAKGKFLKEWKNKNLREIYSLSIDKKTDALFAVDYINVVNIPIGSDLLLFDQLQKPDTRDARISLHESHDCRYHDLAMDNEGSIYVGDILGNRIQKFKRVGK